MAHKYNGMYRHHVLFSNYVSFISLSPDHSYRPLVKWVPGGRGWVPPGEAVAGGYDVSGDAIYVGRALESGDIIPGKIVVQYGSCYVAHGGKEHFHGEYQALVAGPGTELIWVQTDGSSIPSGAVQGGVTATGEPLYIGRHMHNRSLVIGKVHPSHGVLYIPFGGYEHAYSSYEILCVKTIPL